MPELLHKRLFNRATAIVAVVCLGLAVSFSPRAALASEWSVFGEDYPYVEGIEAIVVDGDGNVLYTRSADSAMAMASITKVMTFVVAVESGIPLDSTTVISESITALDPASSIIGYTPGEVVVFSELLRGLMVHSGNDAALIIAELVAGSEAAFVERMNAKALELGMFNTHFANPHGLDQEGHYSTASDLVTLGRYAMRNPLFASIVGAPSATLIVGGLPVTYASTDELLNVYPGMRGIKTGYTYGAGRAFMGLATRGGQSIYMVVLGTDSNETRWNDTWRLLDWAFAHYPEKTLLSGSAPVMGYVPYADHFGWVLATRSVDASIRLSPFEMEPELVPNVHTDLPALASPDEAVAHITWEDGTTLLAARTVYAYGPVMPGVAFGPFVSDDFYGLDRF